MTYSLVRATKADSFTGQTSFAVTLGAAPASGNLLVGIVSATDTGQTYSVTDNQSNTYNVSTFVSNSGVVRSIAFWLGNITNAPTTVTINVTASTNNWSVVIEEWSGISASSDPSNGHTGQDQASPGTATDGITSGSITTTQNGDLIWGATANAGQANTNIASIGTGFTLGTSYVPGSTSLASTISEFETQSSAGAIAATFTQAANNPANTFVVAFKGAGGGSPTDDIAPRSGAITAITLMRDKLSGLFKPRRGLILPGEPEFVI